VSGWLGLASLPSVRPPWLGRVTDSAVLKVEQSVFSEGDSLGVALQVGHHRLGVHSVA